MLTNDLEEAVGLLRNATISAVGRAADMGVVEFLSASHEKFRLHIQCPFRFLHDASIILGSDDMAYPGNRVPRPNEDASMNSMFDSRAIALNGYLEKLHPIVVGVELREGGLLVVTLDGSFALQVFPDSSSGKIEMWRIFVKGAAMHYGFPPNLV